MINNIKIKVNESFVQKAHEKAAERATELGAGKNFKKMSQRYVEGLWKKFVPKLELFSESLEGSVFIDYGCKFGHLTPLLIEQGVKKIYAVDVNDEYLRDGTLVFGDEFPVKYRKSNNCYVDIPSGCADFILTNEVISHINPAFLDVYYSEVARILKPNGELIISDGNNWLHKKTRTDLLNWYQLWEEGISKEFGDNNYLKGRRNIIRSVDPKLSDKEVEYLATNTSGLYGKQISSAIEDYRNECFTERRYRPGSCPTNPSYGVMMEKAFDPTQVIRALEMYGLSSKQLLRGEEREDFMMLGATKNFTIRARKLPENVKALQEFAYQSLTLIEEEYSSKENQALSGSRTFNKIILEYLKYKADVPTFERILKTQCTDYIDVLRELAKQSRKDKRVKVSSEMLEISELLKSSKIALQVLEKNRKLAKPSDRNAKNMMTSTTNFASKLGIIKNNYIMQKIRSFLRNLKVK